MQEYNEAIYDAGLIPAYKPLVNNTPIPAAGEIPANSVTHEELDKVVTAVNSDAVQAAVDTTIKGVRFTNAYQVKPVEMSLEEIVAKMDADARNASASISISEDEILLQVSDMERELVGLIDIQAGAVTALVEGGGATGQMSLSLELPVIIDAATRAQFVQASTEEKVAAVYAQLEGTSGEGIRYAIKGNASNAAVKALWDDAVAGALIASQIDLSATQIHINAQNVQIDGETIINNAKKIKAAMIEVDDFFAKNITVKDQGVLHSSNYNGTIDANGNITAYGSTGWAIDHAGKSDFVDINATGGVFTNVEVNGLIRASGFSLNGFTPGDNVAVEIIMSAVDIASDDMKWTSVGTGTFRVKLTMDAENISGSEWFNWYVYKNDTEVRYNTFKAGKIITDMFELSVNFGDVIKIRTTAQAGRAESFYYSCKLCTNGNNEFFSLFPPVKA